MHIEELKHKVESFRTGLKAALDAVVATIESQERRIADLEARVGIVHLDTFPSGLESKPMHDEAVELQQVKEDVAEKARDALEE